MTLAKAKKFKSRKYSLQSDEAYWTDIQDLQDWIDKKYADGVECGENDDVDAIMAMGDDVAHTIVIKSAKAFADKELMAKIKDLECEEYKSPGYR